MRFFLTVSLLCTAVPTAALAQGQPHRIIAPAQPAAPAQPRRVIAPAPPNAPARPAPNAAVDHAHISLRMAKDISQEPRVDLDFENTPVREAFKRLFEQAKRDYQLDADIPDSARVTVKARNVRFSTALELLLQSAGLGLGHQVNNGKLSYLIQKGGPDTVSSSGLINSLIASKVGIGPTLSIGEFQEGDASLFTEAQTLAQAVPYVLNLHEQRSTFRCPHCKGQSTVIRKPQQPKCEKCSRGFQPGWKFCPSDGARRPAAAGQWKYCPFCSKKVEGEQSGSNPFEQDRLGAGSEFGVPVPAPGDAAAPALSPFAAPTRPAPRVPSMAVPPPAPAVLPAQVPAAPSAPAQLPSRAPDPAPGS